MSFPSLFFFYISLWSNSYDIQVYTSMVYTLQFLLYFYYWVFIILNPHTLYRQINEYQTWFFPYIFMHKKIN